MPLPILIKFGLFCADHARKPPKLRRNIVKIFTLHILRLVLRVLPNAAKKTIEN